MPSSGGSRRVRVERGIYRQTNGRYAVCVIVDGQPRFRTLNAATLGAADIRGSKRTALSSEKRKPPG